MKLINCFGNTAKRNDCCNTAEKEWSRQEQIDYTTEYIQKTFVDKGMCADWSIHDKGDGNPHVHLLVTMRSFNPDHSWGNKEVKDWDFVRDENGNIVVDESHSDWWQDKKNPDRHGIRIPVLDENGNQKVGARNRKQWKRVLTDATGWNNPKNCELWRSEWANVCNAHLKVENHIDHRSYARQGKFEIPTIHEVADARKIDEKFQNGQTSSASWKVEENQIMQRLRERRAGGRTFADDRTDAGRTGSERPDNFGTEQAAKRIADLEREIEQRKQSREYRSIADKIKANRGAIDQRDRQKEKSRRRSRGMEI